MRYDLKLIVGGVQVTRKFDGASLAFFGEFVSEFWECFHAACGVETAIDDWSYWFNLDADYREQAEALGVVVNLPLEVTGPA